MGNKNTNTKIKNIIYRGKKYKKIVVTNEVIVPGANLKDPIPKQVTNK